MQFSMFLPFYLFVSFRVQNVLKKRLRHRLILHWKEVTSFEYPFNLNLSPGVFARNYEQPSIKMQTSENDCDPWVKRHLVCVLGLEKKVLRFHFHFQTLAISYHYVCADSTH